MKKRTTGILLLSSLFLMGAASLVLPGETAREMLRTINVQIGEDNDEVWRVRDSSGANRGTIRARSADNVNWLARGSAMVFTFSSDVDRYFNYESGLFQNGNYQRIEANQRLSLSIREDAPSDTLVYHVYVVDADKYVVGNSPTSMIIN